MAYKNKRAFANIAPSTTDGSIVSAVSGRTIVVTAFLIVAGGTATNITFNTKPAGAGSAISSLIANGANGGVSAAFNSLGWFVTNSGEGLSVTTGSGSSVGVNVLYQEV